MLRIIPTNDKPNPQEDHEFFEDFLCLSAKIRDTIPKTKPAGEPKRTPQAKVILKIPRTTEAVPKLLSPLLIINQRKQRVL